jgi:hypothetical protein
MMNNAKEAKTSEEIYTEFYRQGFDPRIFKAKNNEKAKENSLDFDVATQPKVLADAKTLGRIPKNCNVQATGVLAAQVCDVNVSVEPLSASEAILRMTFSLSVDGDIRHYSLIKRSSTVPLVQKLYSTARPLKNAAITSYVEQLGIAVPIGRGHLQPGSEIFQVDVLWDADRITVTDIVLTQMLVTNAKDVESDFRNSVGFTEQRIEVGYPSAELARNFLFISGPQQTSEFRNNFSRMSGVFDVILTAEKLTRK